MEGGDVEDQDKEEDQIIPKSTTNYVVNLDMMN